MHVQILVCAFRSRSKRKNKTAAAVAACTAAAARAGTAWCWQCGRVTWHGKRVLGLDIGAAGASDEIGRWLQKG